MDPNVVAKFTAALSGPDAVTTDPAMLTKSGHDYWGFGGTPGLMLRPRTRTFGTRYGPKHRLTALARTSGLLSA